jgi:hopanoid biosynthesis associated RND transporter like protein HpnN
VAALHYTVTHLGMNTSTVDMLSEDLPFRQNFKVLDKAFPLEHRTIIAVVEADTAHGAETAAKLLAETLSRKPEFFRSVFYPEADPFFRRNGLLYFDLEELYTFADDLAKVQPLLATLHADMSLRGLSGLLVHALDNAAEPNGLTDELPPIFEEALNAIALTIEKVADGRPADFSWQSILGTDQSDSTIDKRKVMILEPVLDYTSLQPAEQALQTIQDTLGDLGLTPENHIRVRMTGELLMLQDEMKSVQKGIGFVGLLSFALVLILLLLGLRSIPLIVGTIVTLLIGLIWTAFFAAVVIGELNLISVTFAVLFIGLSVDFGIHFVLRYREGVDIGIDRDVALEQAAAGVGGALFLSAAAAAIGFLSFLPTSYRGLSELGLISSAGMLIALFANLTVLPAILSLVPLKAKRLVDDVARVSRLLRFVERKPRTIVSVALSLSIVGALALPFARFDDNPLNLRDRETESVTTLLDLMQDPRIEPFKAETLAPDQKAARRLEARLEALPEVREVKTLLDFIPSDQEEKLDIIGDIISFMAPTLSPVLPRSPSGPGEDRDALEKLKVAASVAGGTGVSANSARLIAALGRLDMTEANLVRLEEALISDFPDVLDRLAEALEAETVSIENLPAMLVKRMRTEDGQLLVEIIPAEDLREEHSRQRFVDAVQQVAPTATGAPIIITEAGRAVIQAFREAGILAGFFVFVLLLVVLRSLLDAVLVMAPLVLAAVLTVAATVILGTPFNFANVIVVPLLFGLGVAGGIHIIVRDRTETSGGIIRTYTPRAVILSALTTIGSFGALALSSHPGTSSMGIMLTISISLATLCTVMVLPAFRLIMRRRRS